MKTNLTRCVVALLALLAMLLSFASCSMMHAADDAPPKDGGWEYGSDAVRELAPSVTGDRADSKTSSPSGDVASDSYYSDDVAPAEPSDPGEKADPDPDEPVTSPDDGEEPRELTSEEINELYRAGLITASAWDDNTYYSMWKKLFEKGQTEEENGRLLGYTEQGWNISSTSRVAVSVTSGEAAVAGAKVVARDADGNTLFKAVTDAKGKAYLFPSAEAGSIVVTKGDATATANFSEEERELSLTLESDSGKKNLIELMFVVDVTGSMGDEINYLKAELGDVIRRIAQNDSETRISLSFLFYRDEDDEEKFCYVDFRDVTDPEDYEVQQAELKKQFATGGGDYPEAMDEALALAVGKQWSASATKMIFLVLDAPCHSTKQNKTTFSSAVRSAAEQGIRICPVLASGADGLTEYLTRSAAVLTGGTFVFITDDSGIGGSHYDPDLPNAVVERLNMLMVRLILGYHTGAFSAPIPWNVEQ